MMMIFVNNGAGGYAFLEHATWNGLYVGDLIFPCFLWIMGFCIPISLSSQLAKGNSRCSMCRGILKVKHVVDSFNKFEQLTPDYFDLCH